MESGVGIWLVSTRHSIPNAARPHLLSHTSMVQWLRVSSHSSADLWPWNLVHGAKERLYGSIQYWPRFWSWLHLIPLAAISILSWPLRSHSIAKGILSMSILSSIGSALWLEEFWLVCCTSLSEVLQKSPSSSRQIYSIPYLVGILVLVSPLVILIHAPLISSHGIFHSYPHLSHYH